MEFKFDEATLRQVVSSAIFEQLLTDDKKAELIQSAIADLLKEKEVKDYNSYGATKKVSIISEAFDLAAQRVAGEIIREEVAKSEEFREAVRSVMRKAIDAILTDEKIGESAALLITNLITKALESYRN